jgi:poly-gamma-glutamate system protein
MKWYRKTIKTSYLMAMVGCSVLALLIVEQSYPGVKSNLYQKKLLAAKLMNEGMQVIRKAKHERGLSLDTHEDPNLTGMIGSRYTEITTTLGSLQAKRTTTNPNFAAVLVEMLTEAGVKQGDVVAAGFSGSFPSLNLATFAASKALGVKLLAIGSVGASTWGATDPEMTWLDMETVVFNQHIVPYRSIAASLGGSEDKGKDFFLDGRERALEAIQRNALPLILEDGLIKSVKKRLEMYRSNTGDQEIKVFINIGGAEANVGNCSHSWQIPPGLVKTLPACSDSNKGVAFWLAEKGAVVINLLNIRDIAMNYGLPIDPIPLPQPGEGAIFYERKLSFVPFFVLVSLAFAIIFLAKKGAV